MANDPGPSTREENIKPNSKTENAVLACRKCQQLRNPSTLCANCGYNYCEICAEICECGDPLHKIDSRFISGLIDLKKYFEGDQATAEHYQRLATTLGVKHLTINGNEENGDVDGSEATDAPPATRARRRASSSNTPEEPKTAPPPTRARMPRHRLAAMATPASAPPAPVRSRRVPKRLQEYETPKTRSRSESHGPAVGNAHTPSQRQRFTKFVNAQTFAVGDLVFAHISGHPKWPATILQVTDRGQIRVEFLRDKNKATLAKGKIFACDQAKAEAYLQEAKLPGLRQALEELIETYKKPAKKTKTKN